MRTLAELIRRLWLGRDAPSVPEPQELSPEDFEVFLERRVQERFGISLAEFRAQLADGRINAESPKAAGLAILVGARAG